MPKIKPVASIALLLAAAGIVFLLTRGPASPEAEAHTGTGAHAQQGPIVPTIPKPSPSLTKTPRAPRPAFTQAEFDRMVQDWAPLNIGPGKYYIYGHEEDEMADRCVARLGCSEDLIRLVKAVMLQDSGIDRSFHGAVKRYLAKAGPAERALVAAITSDPEIRQHWCFYAGGGCTTADLTAFFTLLPIEIDRQATLLGTALYQAKTDPVAALKLTSEQGSWLNGYLFQREAFREIIAAAQDFSLYPAMDQYLRKAEDVIHGEFLDRWTKTDVPGLIRHINAHPDTFNDTGRVFPRMVSYHGLRETLTTIQDLEDPLLFAKAVSVLIPYGGTAYPKEMRELAEQIADPVLRRRIIKEVIDHPESIKGLP